MYDRFDLGRASRHRIVPCVSYVLKLSHIENIYDAAMLLSSQKHVFFTSLVKIVGTCVAAPTQIDLCVWEFGHLVIGNSAWIDTNG